MSAIAAQRPLWLDVDTGIDDALAICLAIASSACDVVGISTVTGNVVASRAAQNSRGLLRLLGADHVPVHVGSPGRADFRLSDVAHGPGGIGYASLEYIEDESHAPQPAAQALCAAAQAHEDLHILALGPLTNLAEAMQLSPDLPRLVADLTIMGGAYRVSGNVNSWAEFNFFADPLSAQLVLDGWANGRSTATLVGLDVTEHAVVDAADLAAVVRDQRLADFIEQSLRYKMDLRRQGGLAPLAVVHDALALWIALHPEIAIQRAVSRPVSVVSRGERAGTVDMVGPGAKHAVVLQTRTDEFLPWVRTTLGRAGQGGSR